MLLGTAIKITVTLSDTADSVIIDIYDPDDDKVVDTQSMTDDGGNVWSYIFQSSEAGEVGLYSAVIRATSGSYTAKSQKGFDLYLERT